MNTIPNWVKPMILAGFAANENPLPFLRNVFPQGTWKCEELPDTTPEGEENAIVFPTLVRGEKYHKYVVFRLKEDEIKKTAALLKEVALKTKYISVPRRVIEALDKVLDKKFGK